MFDFVRTHTKLLQFVLVLLIFPSFVVFGIQGYSRFTDPSNATVAKVGGVSIKQSELEQTHRQQIERMRQRMPNVDVKLFDTPQMKRQTLDEMVRKQVLDMAAQKEHLQVGEARVVAELRGMPEFASVRDSAGNIDKAAYKAFLAARGLTPETFEAEVSQNLSTRQVLQGVNSTLVTGAQVSKMALDAMLERREVQVQRFDAKDYLAKVNPSDADLEAYYAKNQARFHTTEQAKIEYVVLDLDAMKKQVNLNEDDLHKYYEQNISRFTAAEERRAAHILVNAPKSMSDADRAKAKARAQSLLEQARKNPAGFAELAKKNSDDKGSAANGGDLDFFGRGAMVKPFEDAAFSMKPGEISNLVESEFGFHIIKLLEARGGDKKSFESVRQQIVDEVSKPKAQELYAAAADQFTNMAFEQSDSLQPVIDKFKLTKSVVTVQRTPAPGATGPLASTKLLDAVFSNDVIKNKRNTEAIETAANQMVSARIVEYQPEHVQPLAEVRDQVLAVVKAQQAAAAAKKDGEARVADLKAHADATLPQTLVLSRAKAEGQSKLVIDAVLRADIGKGPATIGIDLGDQGYVAARVLKTIPREDNDPDNERARPYVAQALSGAEAAAYYEALKRRYGVEIKPIAPSADAASAPVK